MHYYAPQGDFISQQIRHHHFKEFIAVIITLRLHRGPEKVRNL